MQTICAIANELKEATIKKIFISDYHEYIDGFEETIHIKSFHLATTEKYILSFSNWKNERLSFITHQK